MRTAHILQAATSVLLAPRALAALLRFYVLPAPRALAALLQRFHVLPAPSPTPSLIRAPLRARLALLAPTLLPRRPNAFRWLHPVKKARLLRLRYLGADLPNPPLPSRQDKPPTITAAAIAPLAFTAIRMT
jgi:hypothetical protein